MLQPHNNRPASIETLHILQEDLFPDTLLILVKEGADYWQSVGQSIWGICDRLR